MSKIFYGLLLVVALFIEGFVFFKMITGDKSKIDIVRTPPPAVAEEPQPITIILTGDVMLGRSVMTHTIDSGDFKYPFLHVADALRAADVVFSNLETPITADCPRRDSGMIFCADPRMMEGMTYAGIDVVNIANNHTMNYGKVGFEETKQFLTQNNISYVGDFNLAIKDVKGTKVGFLGFDYVTNKVSEEDLNVIAGSKSKVDILIVGVHWGSEYQAKAGKLQEDTAIQMIEKGADVIAGHHPHWVQNTAMHNSKPIYYSLGNFIFDQMWSENTKKGMAIRLTMKGNDVVRSEELPLYMRKLGQPEWSSSAATKSAATP